MKKPSLNGHALCRPPRGAKPVRSEYTDSAKLWRLGDDKKWRADNGKPGFAFVGEDATGNVIVWLPECKCPYAKGCAQGAAGAFVFDKLDITAITYARRRPV